MLQSEIDISSISWSEQGAVIFDYRDCKQTSAWSPWYCWYCPSVVVIAVWTLSQLTSQLLCLIICLWQKESLRVLYWDHFLICTMSLKVTLLKHMELATWPTLMIPSCTLYWNAKSQWLQVIFLNFKILSNPSFHKITIVDSEIDFDNAAKSLGVTIYKHLDMKKQCVKYCSRCPFCHL